VKEAGKNGFGLRDHIHPSQRCTLDVAAGIVITVFRKTGGGITLSR